MTLTLELTPAQEWQLLCEADAQGLDLQSYAYLRLLGEVPKTEGQEERQARRSAATKALRGALAHLEGVSSYQFIEDKKKEMELEDRF